VIATPFDKKLFLIEVILMWKPSSMSAPKYED